jgi:hypothetical protein
MSKPNKYRRPIPARALRNNGLDVYDVLTAFDVTCPAIGHAVKKLLCAGVRGYKSQMQDMTEAVQSVLVAIEYAHDAQAAAPPDIPSPLPKESE